jgi:hypothetical protein
MGKEQPRHAFFLSDFAISTTITAMTSELIQKLRARLVENRAVLLGWLIVAWVMAQIQTYVCGQDPYLYIYSARGLVQAGFSLSQIAKVASYMAPGYPLLLAASIKVFGFFAPYWVNFFLTLGLLTLLVQLTRRIVGSRFNEDIFVISLLFLLLRGYGLNPHFLLYAFRGAPALFMMFLGMLLVWETGKRSCPSWLAVAAGCALLVASSIREPAALAFVGPLLMLPCRKENRKQAMVSFLLILVPGLIAAGILGCLIAAGVVEPNFQIRLWFSRFSGTGMTVFLGGLRANTARIYGFLLESLQLGFEHRVWRWCGPVLMLAGLWRMRRNLAAWLYFILPGVTFFLFYACYKAHRRFFLTTLIFFAPVFAGGVEWVFSAIKRFAVGRMRLSPRLVQTVLVLLLLVPLARTIHTMGPWGPDVSLSEAKELQRVIKSASIPGGKVIIEQRCSILVDPLITLTDVQPEAATKVRALLQTNGSAVFAKPVTEACFSRSVRYKGAFAEEIVKHYADVIPILDGSDRPLTWTVDEAVFSLTRVVPWSHTNVTKEIMLEPGKDAVIWLDLRSARKCSRKIVVSAADGSLLASCILKKSGLRAIHVPGALVKDREAIVKVSGSEPMPYAVVHDVVSEGRAALFPVSSERSLSVGKWFQAPFLTGDATEKYAARFVDGGVLLLPTPQGNGHYTMRIHLDMDTRAVSGEEITVKYSLGDSLVAERKALLAGGMTGHDIEIEGVGTGDEIPVRLDVVPPDCRGTHFRIHAVGLSFTKTDTD